MTPKKPPHNVGPPPCFTVSGIYVETIHSPCLHHTNNIEQNQRSDTWPHQAKAHISTRLMSILGPKESLLLFAFSQVPHKIVFPEAAALD